MTLAIISIVLGTALLLWSAGLFVSGAAALSSRLGVPPLVVGMVVVGFGTSAPEIVVSILSALQGNPGLALGNAYGSNITNIALILGITALMSPIVVASQVVRKEMPILLGVTALAVVQMWDLELSRADAWGLLLVFGGVMAWTVWVGLKGQDDHVSEEISKELEAYRMSLGRALGFLVLGLILLVVSSRALVYGAVEIAQMMGVSDLVIGLTVVAVGTSLPELASSVVAARRGEHDLAVGNVIGSNLFNTLVVVGIAGMIHPMQAEAILLERDLLVMGVLTVALFFMSLGIRRRGRINRLEGVTLLLAYVGYTVYLIVTSK
jgi:cation:H+ antiporter